MYDRPIYTEMLLEKLKHIKPTSLFIFCDGPKNQEVAQGIIKSKNLINRIDWDCTIETNYLGQNLGPGKGISNALSWFFSQVEMGIIFESDCIPAISFFKYCEQLLIKYKDDNRIWSISGNNFKEIPTKDDYYFCKNMFLWGFATWRRVWEKYDFLMLTWDEKAFKKHITNYYRIRFIANHQFFRIKGFYESNILTHRFGSWDIQLFYSQILNNAFCIIPQKNLVSNIGIQGGVHHNKKKFYHELQVDNDYMVKRHPKDVKSNLFLDIFYFLFPTYQVKLNDIIERILRLLK